MSKFGDLEYFNYFLNIGNPDKFIFEGNIYTDRRTFFLISLLRYVHANNLREHCSRTIINIAKEKVGSDFIIFLLNTFETNKLIFDKIVDLCADLTHVYYTHSGLRFDFWDFVVPIGELGEIVYQRYKEKYPIEAAKGHHLASLSKNKTS